MIPGTFPSKWHTNPPNVLTSSKDPTISLITAACNVSASMKKLLHGKSLLFWWTAQIAWTASKFSGLHNMQRGQDEVTLRSIKYKRGKKELRHETTSRKHAVDWALIHPRFGKNSNVRSDQREDSHTPPYSGWRNQGLIGDCVEISRRNNRHDKDKLLRTNSQHHRQGGQCRRSFSY